MKEETLKREYLENQLDGIKIAEKYNISVSTVYKKLKEYNIEIRPRYKNSNQVLSGKEEEFLFGKILGDGYLRPNTVSINSSFSFAHSIKQYEYCLYSYSFIKSWCSREPQYREQKRDPEVYKNPIIKKYIVETISHPEFSRLRRYFYDCGKKIINKDILSNITPLGLAIWYQDDGSLEVQNKKNNGMRIATNQFPYESVKMISNWLKDTYDINSNPVSAGFGRDSVKQYIVRISKKSTLDFSNLIREFVHPSLHYKLVDDIV
jgi:hypothetical protein